jgi:hypothetical protein
MIGSARQSTTHFGGISAFGAAFTLFAAALFSATLTAQGMPERPSGEMPGKDLPGKDMPGKDMPGKDAPKAEKPADKPPEKAEKPGEMPDKTAEPAPKRDTAKEASEFDPPPIQQLPKLYDREAAATLARTAAQGIAAKFKLGEDKLGKFIAIAEETARKKHEGLAAAHQRLPLVLSAAGGEVMRLLNAPDGAKPPERFVRMIIAASRLQPDQMRPMPQGGDRPKMNAFMALIAESKRDVDTVRARVDALREVLAAGNPWEMPGQRDRSANDERDSAVKLLLTPEEFFRMLEAVKPQPKKDENTARKQYPFISMQELADLVKDLDLSDDQRERINALLTSKEMADEVKYDKVVAVLTADQKDRLEKGVRRLTKRDDRRDRKDGDGPRPNGEKPPLPPNGQKPQMPPKGEKPPMPPADGTAGMVPAAGVPAAGETMPPASASDPFAGVGDAKPFEPPARPVKVGKVAKKAKAAKPAVAAKAKPAAKAPAATKTARPAMTGRVKNARAAGARTIVPKATKPTLHLKPAKKK